MRKIESFYNFCHKCDLYNTDVKLIKQPTLRYEIKKGIKKSNLENLSKEKIIEYINTLGTSVTLKLKERNAAADSMIIDIDQGIFNIDPAVSMERVARLDSNRDVDIYFSIDRMALFKGLKFDTNFLMFFCRKLKIDDETFLNKDTINNVYNLKVKTNSVNYTKMYLFLWHALAFVFSSAITLKVKTNLETPIITINKGKCEKLKRGLAEIINFENPEDLSLSIDINKDILVERLRLKDTPFRVKLFFWEQRLTKILKAPIHKLESNLIAKKGKPTIIIVLDTEICIRGQFFNVMNRKNIHEFKKRVPNIDDETKRKVEVYRQMAFDRLNWNGISIKELTPLHFKCSRISGKSGEIDEVIAAIFLHLTILYSANLSSYNDEKKIFSSSYIGSNLTARLTLTMDNASEIDLESLNWLTMWLFSDKTVPTNGYDAGNEGKNIDTKTGHGVTKRKKWLTTWLFSNKTVPPNDHDTVNEEKNTATQTGHGASENKQEIVYSDKVTERLIMLQSVITRIYEIQNGKPDENYILFIKRLKELKDDVYGHYRVFIEGQIDKHFEQIQKVEYDLADVAKEVSKKIDSVTKGFIDTFLATIGVIVLTIVASLIKKETHGILFRFGMWIYASYLLIFHVLYRMASIWGSYSHLQTITDERIKNYKSKVSKKRMTILLKPLEQQKRQFEFWFYLTVVIYFVVIFALVALGQFLPGFL